MCGRGLIRALFEVGPGDIRMVTEDDRRGWDDYEI